MLGEGGDEKGASKNPWGVFNKLAPVMLLCVEKLLGINDLTISDKFEILRL